MRISRGRFLTKSSGKASVSGAAAPVFDDEVRSPEGRRRKSTSMIGDKSVMEIEYTEIPKGWMVIKTGFVGGGRRERGREGRSEEHVSTSTSKGNKSIHGQLQHAKQVRDFLFIYGLVEIIE